MLPPTDDNIAFAAGLLREGELAAFPTETVYGLGGDALSGAALAKIFAAKGRPVFDPLILHIADMDALEGLADFAALGAERRRLLEKLAAAFWPGPLTMVLPKLPAVPDLATAALPTAAIRFPRHPVAQGLIRLAGRPVAAPSANLFGRLSPTRAEHVAEQLAGRIRCVLDGGPCEVGLESTVLDLSSADIRLLRPGGLGRERIEEIAGPVKTGATPGAMEENPTKASGGGFASPGMLKSHYAPRTPLLLRKSLAGFTEAGAGEGLLYYKAPSGAAPDAAGGTGSGALRWLCRSGDSLEAAANLFRVLHEMDAAGFSRIVAEEAPAAALGEAINDRLRRAAAKT